MKISWIIIAIAGLSAAAVLAQAPPYQVTERGANHRVWQRTTYESAPDGKAIPRIHQYTELASGLNFWDSTTGQWLESKEEIEPFEQGAIARQGQYQVIFANNLNTAGAIDMRTPDGRRLRSNVLGLGYYDQSTSNSVLIAQLQDSEGVLIASNQVLFSNAFEGMNADVRYTYRRGGFEQDVILREQPPRPEAFGLNPDTTELEVLTEFINPPPATVKERKGRNSVSMDQDISWGTTLIGRGRTFDLGEQKNVRTRVPVNKQYTTVQGRTFLLEKVPMKNIQSQLANLPAQASAKPKLPTMVSKQPLLPKAPLAQAAEKPMKLASASLPNKGYVLDYVTISSDTNDFTFKGDTTYYINGGVNLSGTTTFEGGTVIKIANNLDEDTYYYDGYNGNGLLSCGQIVCRTAAYRPAVFTSMDDDSVGEAISGSSGNPSTLTVPFLCEADMWLESVTFTGLRFSYAGVAVMDLVFDHNAPVFRDCQFVHCGIGFGGAVGTSVTFENCLLAGEIGIKNSEPDTYVLNNVTMANSSYNLDIPDTDSSLGWLPFGAYLYITNTLFSGGQTLSNVESAVMNAGGSVNDVANADVSSSDFQTIGAGSYYLTTNSPYRNAGSTNIGPALLAELRRKTTWPPVVYSNTTISVPMTFSPQAQRDTDTPDLGYHYDPIDYFFGGVAANSNLTFTAGTTVGWFYNSSGAAYGMTLGDSVTASFNGTLTTPCIFARYNTVQEGGNGYWQSQGYLAGITGQSYNNATPTITAQFTHCSMLNNEGNVFRDNCILLNIRAVNCEFYSGSAGGYYASENFTNCLFVNCAPGLWWNYDEANLTLWNCTLIRGNLTADHDCEGTWPVTIVNCAFDRTSIYMNDHEWGTDGAYCDYNAFLEGADRTAVEGGNEVTIPFDENTPNADYHWQSGPLGSYYLPANSPLIDHGSTTADQVGLYHFTTQTNQVKETNSVVDIGYHYVAADAGGNLLDTDGDGISDCQEDGNGNGVYDSGDPSDWEDYYNGTLPNLAIVGGNFQCGSPGSLLPLALSVRVTDTNNVALTNAPLTFTVTQGGLKTSTNGPATNSVAIRTDSNGVASVYYELPVTTNADCFVGATAWSGTNAMTVVFKEHAQVPMISIGDSYSLYLCANGRVLAWGWNDNGELGNGTFDGTNRPSEIPSLTNIVKISAGAYHALALGADGRVWAWGANYNGELGSGATNEYENSPVLVYGLTNVVDIAAGGYNSFAIETDGSVWAWGDIYETNGCIPDPQKINGIANAKQIAGGDDYVLVLLTNGTVMAWGKNGYGQLGNGTFDDSEIPTQVTNLCNIVQIAAGYRHGLALQSNGAVWAWGRGSYGQLGDGTTQTAVNVPVQAANLTTANQIAAGYDHSAATDNQGHIWTWGRNSSGQLGIGNEQDSHQPVLITGLSNAIAAGAGGDFSAALKSDGSLAAWGGDYGANWELGFGVSDSSNVPGSSRPYSVYYNPIKPKLQIVQGNSQAGNFLAGYFPQPLVFRVTDQGDNVLTNAPVYVQVAQGDVVLNTNIGSEQFQDMRLDTDMNGEVEVFVYADDKVNTDCVINVYAAGPEGGLGVGTNFQETIFVPQIQITGGQYQTNSAGLFVPITVQPTGASPPTNIQALLSVVSGAARLATATNGTSETGLTLNADEYGLASFFVYFPTNVPLANFLDDSISVSLSAGGNSIETNFNPNIVGYPSGTYWWGLPDYLADPDGSLAAWEMYYLSQYGLDLLGDYDNDGTNNWQEFQNGANPNKISFSFSVPNQYVTNSLVGGVITILSGVPLSLSVLVDNTNFASAVWTNYTSTNITVDIGTNQDPHNVWVGLRGFRPEVQTWEGTTLILNSVPPMIAITNPANNATFNASRVNVSGNFTAGALRQITVNNMVAFVNGTNFEARNVPLVGGANAIVAVIEDLTGMTNATSITVTGTTNLNGSLDDPVQLGATPVAGFAPLTVTFQITSNSTPGTLQQVLWDFNGDGITDLTTNNADPVAYTYTNGEYFPVVTIQTTTGRFSSIGGWNGYSLDSTNQPIRINVQMPATQSTFAGITDPVDLKWDGTHLYVLSGSSGTITEFATNGSSIGSPLNIGTACSGFDVDAAGNVYVAVTSSNQVWKFNPTEGLFVADTNFGIGGCIGHTDGATGTGTNEFSAPYDVAVSLDGQTISVSDSGNHRIQQFSATNGAFIASFGSQGNAVGQFNAPKGLTCDSLGTLYIADSGNNRIVLAQGSAVMDATGSGGSDLGKFSGPLNISIGKRGVYVADSGNGRIQKFDLPAQGFFEITSGNVSYALSTGLSSPAAVAAVDNLTNELFYVADTGNNQVILCHLPDRNADGILAVWNGMKACIANGDISGAAQYFSSKTADAYQQAFLAMGTDNATSIIGQIGTLSPASIDSNLAQYYFEQTIAGLNLAFPVRFIKEESGWKILQF